MPIAKRVPICWVITLLARQVQTVVFRTQQIVLKYQTKQSINLRLAVTQISVMVMVCTF